jgi:hypothetical protein
MIPKAMTLIAIALIALALLANTPAAQESTPPAPPPAQTTPATPPAQRPAPTPAPSAAAPETGVVSGDEFIPSQELQADEEATFPVDI